MAEGGEGKGGHPFVQHVCASFHPRPCTRCVPTYVSHLGPCPPSLFSAILTLVTSLTNTCAILILPKPHSRAHKTTELARRMLLAYLLTGLSGLCFLTATRAQQSEFMITTTSCRTILASEPTNTQGLTKPSGKPDPPRTTQCATGTRAPRVSLSAAPGVFASVYDNWGACGQYVEFPFAGTWNGYGFTMVAGEQTDTHQPVCAAAPTKTMTVGPPLVLIMVTRRDWRTHSSAVSGSTHP